MSEDFNLKYERQKAGIIDKKTGKVSPPYDKGTQNINKLKGLNSKALKVGWNTTSNRCSCIRNTTKKEKIKKEIEGKSKFPTDPVGKSKGGVTKAKDGKSIGNLLKPGEEPGEGYEGSPDMYPDYGEDRKDAKEAGKDKAYMQSRGYNEGGSVSRGVGKAIRGTKFKGVF
jgi:hypothetical protein